MTELFGMPPFRPRWPWIGGDLQTLRSTIAPLRVDLSPWPGQRLLFEAADGRDQLSGVLQSPVSASGKPLVVLVHGMGGSLDSPGVQVSAFNLLQAGYPVLRINQRGAGETAPFCRTHHHSGLTADLDAVLDQLPRTVLSEGIVLFGYSQGGNTVLNHVEERRSSGHVRAAVSVCAPINPGAAADRIAARRNRLYQAYLIRRLQERARASRMEPGFVAASGTARTIREYDDRVTARLFGYDGVDDFYRAVAPLPRLTSIRVPTLIVHAADDPWVPVRDYRSVDWSANSCLMGVIAEGGGHCGFHAADEALPWHDRLGLLFLARVL